MSSGSSSGSEINTSKASAIAGLIVTIGIIFLIFTFTYIDNSVFKDIFRLGTYVGPNVNGTRTVGFIQ